VKGNGSWIKKLDDKSKENVFGENLTNLTRSRIQSKMLINLIELNLTEINTIKKNTIHNYAAKKTEEYTTCKMFYTLVLNTVSYWR